MREHSKAQGGFSEALTVFREPFEISIADPDHSILEQRFLSMGLSLRGRTLVFTYVVKSQNGIRIVRAGQASNRELRD